MHDSEKKKAELLNNDFNRTTRALLQERKNQVDLKERHDSQALLI